jgi:hypothetical protein
MDYPDLSSVPRCQPVADKPEEFLMGRANSMSLVNMFLVQLLCYGVRKSCSRTAGEPR